MSEYSRQNKRSAKIKYSLNNVKYTKDETNLLEGEENNENE